MGFLWSDVRNKYLLKKFTRSISIFVLFGIILWFKVSYFFISFCSFYYTEKLEYLALSPFFLDCLTYFMRDTSFNPYRVWSAESFWLIWGHCSRHKVLWILSPVSWPQDYSIPKPNCSIPYLLLGDLTNSLYGQLLLLQRQIVLTRTVVHCVHVERWNATRQTSTYYIIISAVSKNWGGFSFPPFCFIFQTLSFLGEYPTGLGTGPQTDS